nr:hypothetical protein [Ktedonobacteraceae bacterium]
QKDGTKERYVYACTPDGTVGRCNKISIRCSEVDEEAWKYVKELMKDQNKVEERLAEIEKKLTSNPVDVTPIDNQIAEIERQQRNCAKAMVTAKDDEYMSQLFQQEAHELAKARREAEKLRADVLRGMDDFQLVRSKLDEFRKRWLDHKTKLEEEPTYTDKRLACSILGLKATLYSAGHLPRYKFTITPPEIEFLILLHRAERQPRPWCVSVPAG